MSKPKIINKDELLINFAELIYLARTRIQGKPLSSSLNEACDKIKALIQNQPEVDEEFIKKWGLEFVTNTIYDGQIFKNVKQMLKEADYNIVSKPEITMKDIEGWADEARERVTNHDWGYLADVMKEMVEEEFGIKVKK